MAYVVVDLFLVLSTAAVAGVGGWCLGVRFAQRYAGCESDARGRQAARVLAQLHEVATRVAVDVEAHSSRVEQINSELEAAGDKQPAAIVDVVARLIENNQQMRERLADSEDRLKQQAVEIQTHVTEARTDALTLLANRRAFDDELACRMRQFEMNARPFSLIIVDIDHFKQFNDAHGHQAGDRVLCAVARTLRQGFREVDLVARYGGEEFAIIMPGACVAVAGDAADRVRLALEQTCVTFEGKSLRVTGSFGTAEASPDANAAIMIERADKALYAAKQAGRNAVWCHDGHSAYPWNVPVAIEAPAVAAADEPPPAEEIDGQAIGDPAAAVPNRTNFCQQVRARFAEWKRGGAVFSVVLVRVHRGRLEGRLENCAAYDHRKRMGQRAVMASVREMDMVGRYAADCFAMLLPTAGLVNSVHVAERLRVEFKAAHATTDDETLSLGVAQVVVGDDLMSLLRRAEEALEAAERSEGKGCYYSDGDGCLPAAMLTAAWGGVPVGNLPNPSLPPSPASR
jgi:diguanylate cyclase